MEVTAMATPKGTRVLINSATEGLDVSWTISATVEDKLAVQFTARWDDTGALSFLFYNDEGDTWRNADE
jgi:hypothetical protein